MLGGSLVDATALVASSVADPIRSPGEEKGAITTPDWPETLGPGVDRLSVVLAMERDSRGSNVVGRDEGAHVDER